MAKALSIPLFGSAELWSELCWTSRVYLKTEVRNRVAIACTGSLL